jgi:hypothetical protein
MSSDWPRRKGRGDIGGGIRLRFEVSALPGFRVSTTGYLLRISSSRAAGKF